MATQSSLPSLQLKKTSQQIELRFESRKLGIILSLSSEVVAHLNAHRQQGRIKTEIGGQLFAQFAKGEVRIIRATGPNSTDRRGWSWFRPDQRKQNTEIKRLFDESLHFVGDWHTHPEAQPNPSSWDFESMEDCFRKSRHELKAFVMIIVGRAEFPKGLWVSLHDKTRWERLIPLNGQDLTKPADSNSIKAVRD